MKTNSKLWRPRKNVICAVTVLLLLALVMPLGILVPASTSMAPITSFDRPLKKIVLDLGPSPYYAESQNVREKLSCYFYATIVVKQYDEGQKGAEWLAILPIKKGAVQGCTMSHSSGEMVIDGAEWSGYFKGVKGDQVFFDAADGTNGGLPFAVFNSQTGKKIFEDSAFDSSMWSRSIKFGDSPFNRLRVSIAQDGLVSLKYLRVVEAGCDIYKEKISCWDQVRKRLDLKSSAIPACTLYENLSQTSESAVAYPVQVILSPQSTINSIAGPVKCWPVD